jgi:hypothetical protein
VLAALTGWTPPVPGQDFSARMSGLPARLLGCALSHAAVAARISITGGHADPAGLAVHVTAGLRDYAAAGRPYPAPDARWLAGPCRWSMLVRGNPDSPTAGATTTPPTTTSTTTRTTGATTTAKQPAATTRPVGRHLPRRRIPRRQQQPHPPRRRTRTPQPGDPAADSGTDNGQPDESPAQAADSENVLSPEQERIHALETENADARHTIADLQEKNAAANQQIADLKADKDELTARLDLIEQHPASNDGYQDRETRRPDHGADGPDGPREENRTRCSTSA